VRPFSEEAMEFSEEKRVVFLKKVLLSPKKGLQTFSEEAMDFSEHKIGIWPVGVFLTRKYDVPYN